MIVCSWTYVCPFRQALRTLARGQLAPCSLAPGPYSRRAALPCHRPKLPASAAGPAEPVASALTREGGGYNSKSCEQGTALLPKSQRLGSQATQRADGRSVSK